MCRMNFVDNYTLTSDCTIKRKSISYKQESINYPITISTSCLNLNKYIEENNNSVISNDISNDNSSNIEKSNINGNVNIRFCTGENKYDLQSKSYNNKIKKKVMYIYYLVNYLICRLHLLK